LLHFGERNTLKRLWEKERIAKRSEVCVKASALQVGEKAGLIALEIAAMELRIEVDLAEGEKRLGLEQVGMRLEQSLQVGIGGLGARGKIV
jgi:hypothetical protein